MMLHESSDERDWRTESQPGEGTASGEPAAAPVEPARRRMSRPTEPPRVLLADDDEETREMLATALREYGYDVTEARDGTELAAFLTWSLVGGEPGDSVDLVVTDVHMPGLSGLEALEQIRNLDPSLRAIVITGFPNDALEADARRLGADVVFDKPFLLDNLLIAVLSLVPPFEPKGS
ncbi:MAG: response regulator [Deltaproteobacteria bacterium]|nr:response regulator [Deltaproteobacteria bacterium]